MNIPFHSYVAFLALSVHVLMAPNANVSAGDVTSIRMGSPAATHSLPLWVAKERGFFSKHGLDAEVIIVRGGPLAITAVLGDSLQFAAAGMTTMLPARLKGADLNLIACPLDTDIYYLIARPEIKRVADLKGKSSGVTRFGSVTHFALRFTLKHLGLDPERDVSVLQMGETEAIAAALNAGKISFATLSINTALAFLDRGWPVLTETRKTDFVSPPSCILGKQTFIRKNGEVAKRVLKAYVEAINSIKENPSGAARIFGKWTRASDDAKNKKIVEAYAQVFKRVPSVPDRGIDFLLKEYSEKQAVPSPLIDRPDYFRDNGPLESLVREGWIDQFYK